MDALKKGILKRTRYTAFISLLFGLVLFFGATVAMSATVSINPSNQTVSPEETFTVGIYCIPEQPIKAYEFKLSFDASLLRANSVTEGDIFSGYTTFFNSGTIDNTAGTIVNVYGVIIGSGNVSSPGSFATISFTAKTSLSTSLLHLYDVGVTNETEYIPVATNDGNATIYSSDIPHEEEPGGGSNPPPITEVNSAPNQPVGPSGPALIQRGVVYEYSSCTYDVDGDQVKLMFDWGDGTYSDWSNFVASNTTISMSHSWDLVSGYTIKVIAQDKKGLNSTWSEPLVVTISETGSGDNAPFAEIKIPDKVVSNETVVFDASGSYDPDGVIVSYYWDFGDGETVNVTNTTITHVYKTPGGYTVTLSVTDNEGNARSASINVNVASEAAEGDSSEKENGNLSDFGNLIIIIIGVILLFTVFLLILFRKRIWN